MSRNRRQAVEESKPKIPAYIVTFSDMITLLLTFFVMLLSLAKRQDPELFHKTRNAFVVYIKNIGFGVLTGRKITPELGEAKVKYFIRVPDKLHPIRSINAKEENVRRIFKKITQTMSTMPSQIVAKSTNFSVTNITFSPDESQLNEPSERFLTQFALDLQQSTSPNAVKLYVLGLARDERNKKKQWILSAQRAQAVADFLNNILPSELQWPVYSWGAGPGGYWVDQNSPISKQSQILIAVLRAND